MKKKHVFSINSIIVNLFIPLWKLFWTFFSFNIYIVISEIKSKFSFSILLIHFTDNLLLVDR